MTDLSRFEVNLIADALDAHGHRDRSLASHLRPIGGSSFVGPAKTILFRVLPAERRFAETKLEDLVNGLKKREAYLSAGSVVVIGFEGDPTGFGIMGGTLATFYRRLGIAGVVTDGFVRDAAQIRELGLPVIAAGTHPTNAKGRVAGGPLGQPVRVGGVEIADGDIVAADADGVVAVPRALAGDAGFLEWLARADQRDREMQALLREGTMLSDVVSRFGVP